MFTSKRGLQWGKGLYFCIGMCMHVCKLHTFTPWISIFGFFQEHMWTKKKNGILVVWWHLLALLEELLINFRLIK